MMILFAFRYEMLHSEKRDKDWKAARSYYERSAFVMPHYGNPHNQVTVGFHMCDLMTPSSLRFSFLLLFVQSSLCWPRIWRRNALRCFTIAAV